MALNTKLATLGLAGLLAACGGSDTDTDTDPDEPTRFRVEIENITVAGSHLSTGAAAIPVGESEAGPIFPGGVYETSFYAGPGTSLSFAAMMVQSNDWFFAPAPEGIPLFDEEGTPLEGDITGEVYLYDAGSEADETPGEGANQAPRQSGPNTGPDDPNPNVREVTDSSLPDIDDMISVSLTWAEGNMFTLRVENVSTASTLPTSGDPVPVPIAPVALVVHTADEPIFTLGMPATAGLAMLAEDGAPTGLVAELEASTQVATPLAPGVWAVDMASAAMFDDNAPARGNGLEMLAEDGDPSVLAATLADAMTDAGVFNTPTGASAPGPAFPGDSYSFEIEALEGDTLHFATMVVQSNDWFIAPGTAGIALFDAAGAPVSGDITSQLSIWDAGTEVDEAPGAGPNQAPRQAAANTGADENGNVRVVTPEAPVPGVTETVRVTITPL